MTFKCHCGETIKYEDPCNKGCYNVGAAQKATSWLFIPFDDGDTQWLCDSCGPRAQKLAQELVEITGIKDLYLRTLFPCGGIGRHNE